MDVAVRYCNRRIAHFIFTLEFPCFLPSLFTLRFFSSPFPLSLSSSFFHFALSPLLFYSAASSIDITIIDFQQLNFQGKFSTSQTSKLSTRRSA